MTMEDVFHEGADAFADAALMKPWPNDHGRHLIVKEH